jgi:serine/threonine protein kinase
MKKIGNITLIKELGKGSYGKVFLSTIDGKNEYFATKVMDRQRVDQNKKYFDNEITLLKSLKHPNILKFVDLQKTENSYYLVTEYINGGSLSDCLKRYQKLHHNKAFTEEILQHLMRQIVDAIKYMHGFKIIHRDLKLDNIMVNFDNENDNNNCNMLRAKVKLIDFGLAKQLPKSGLTTTALGSPINMDPYILKKFKNRENKTGGYNEKIDIWSLGTVCYEMLIGKVVFEAESIEDLIRKIDAGNYTLPTSLSKEVVSFINAMLQYDAANRYSASELSKHPFLRKRVSEFSKIDTKRASRKIDRKGLNINVKKNNTIWGIFNEDDEVKLTSIIYEENPINEQVHMNIKNKQKTLKNYDKRPMKENFNLRNEDFIPRQNTPDYTNQNSFLNSNNGNSFYGQSMFPNNSKMQNKGMQNINRANQNQIQYYKAMQQQNMNNYSNAYQPQPNYGMNNNNINYTNNLPSGTIINNGTVYLNQDQAGYRPMDNDDTEKEEKDGCIII